MSLRRRAHGRAAAHAQARQGKRLAETLEVALEWLDAQALAAQQIAHAIAESMGIIGLLAVELFLTKEGRLLVNELAPRPHNTYHHSERAHSTSQFEQLVRAVCGLPLGSVDLVTPASIANLLGDLWVEGDVVSFRCRVPERNVTVLNNGRCVLGDTSY